MWAFLFAPLPAIFASSEQLPETFVFFYDRHVIKARIVSDCKNDSNDCPKGWHTSMYFLCFSLATALQMECLRLQAPTPTKSCQDRHTQKVTVMRAPTSRVTTIFPLRENICVASEFPVPLREVSQNTCFTMSLFSVFLTSQVSSSKS